MDGLSVSPLKKINSMNQSENHKINHGISLKGINKWLLRFEEKKLEEEYSKSQ